MGKTKRKQLKSIKTSIFFNTLEDSCKKAISEG